MKALRAGRWAACLLAVCSLVGIISIHGAPTDVIVPERAFTEAVDEVLLENNRPSQAERLAKLGLTRDQVALREQDLIALNDVNGLSDEKAADMRSQATSAEGYKAPTTGVAALRTFWNCAKPSCAWKENVKPAPVNDSMVATCDISGHKLSTSDGANILGGGGDRDAVSYTCPNQVPEYDAATDLLYAFAASSTSCCACYELSFSPAQLNKDGRVCTLEDVQNVDANCILAKLRQSQIGRRMLIQVISSNDVGSHHFDIMVPGSGLKTPSNNDQGCIPEDGTSLNGPAQFDEANYDAFSAAGINITAVSGVIGMTEANVRTQFGMEAYDRERFIAHMYTMLAENLKQSDKWLKALKAFAQGESESWQQEAAQALQLKDCSDVPVSLRPGCEQYTEALVAWGADSISSRTVNYHRIQCPARLTAKSQCIPADDRMYPAATGSPTDAPTTSAPSFSPSNSPSLSPSHQPTSSPSKSPSFSPSHQPSFSPTTAMPTGAPTLVNPDQVTTVSIEFNLPDQQTVTPVPGDTPLEPQTEQLMEVDPQEDIYNTSAPTVLPVHYNASICSAEGKLTLLEGIRTSLESNGYVVTNETIIEITQCEVRVHSPAPTPMSYGEMLLKQGRPTPAPTPFGLQEIEDLAQQLGSHADVQYTVTSENGLLATDVMAIVSDQAMSAAMRRSVPLMASEPVTVELTAGFPPTPSPTTVPTAGPTIPKGPMQKADGHEGNFSEYTECRFGCRGCESSSEDATCNIYTNDLSEACPEVAGYNVNTTYRETLDENGETISDNLLNYCNYMVNENCGAACSDALLHPMCVATCDKYKFKESSVDYSNDAHDAAHYGMNVLQTWLNMHNLTRSIDSFTEMKCGWWYIESSVCWCGNICYATEFESMEPDFGCCSLDGAKVAWVVCAIFLFLLLVFVGTYQYYLRVWKPKQEDKFLGKDFEFAPVHVFAAPRFQVQEVLAGL